MSVYGDIQRSQSSVQRASVLVDHERYILLIGGVKDDQIHIIDLKGMSVSRSVVSCPMPGTYRVGETMNVQQSLCITYGFVRTANHVA